MLNLFLLSLIISINKGILYINVGTTLGIVSGGLIIEFQEAIITISITI